jgi:hypothetical protein
LNALLLGQPEFAFSFMNRMAEAFAGSIQNPPFVGMHGLAGTVCVCELGPNATFTFRCWAEVRRSFCV